jgi:hypothetical protein
LSTVARGCILPTETDTDAGRYRIQSA